MSWNPDEKKRETEAPESRYIIVQSEDEAEKDISVGFLSWRCDIENNELVLYIYELYVDSKWRRKGIARHLIRLAEEIAVKTGKYSLKNVKSYL